MSDNGADGLLQQTEAVRLIELLNAAGFETRFVGGCVRDALMHRTLGDVDLATTALPEQMMAILAKNNVKTIPTGITHGTITAVTGGMPFEITTLRKDVETDGRHAIVAFTDNWQEDALRRDFTINALSVDRNGRLFDYCGGKTDLEQKNLRFIGNAEERIREDYLRILRFFRFASVLNWEVTNMATLEICQILAPHIKSLSRERIQAEIYKLLLGDGCLRTANSMADCDILCAFVPQIDIMGLHELVTKEEKYGMGDAFRRLLALTGWPETGALEYLIVPTRENKKRLAGLDNFSEKRDWPLYKLLYFYGMQAVKDFYFLAQTQWDYAQIENWQKPACPLKAEHVLSLANNIGSEIGKLLKQAENYWVEQEFKPSVDDLLAFLDR